MAGKAVYKKFSTKFGTKLARNYLYGEGAPMIQVRKSNGDYEEISMGESLLREKTLLKARISGNLPPREQTQTVDKLKSIWAGINFAAGRPT